MTNYQVLKAAGHSAAKAAEIALDAKRGNAYAIAWINQLRKETDSEAYEVTNPCR